MQCEIVGVGGIVVLVDSLYSGLARADEPQMTAAVPGGLAIEDQRERAGGWRA
jgi:hypothetical protein